MVKRRRGRGRKKKDPEQESSSESVNSEDRKYFDIPKKLTEEQKFIKEVYTDRGLTTQDYT